MSNLYDVMTQVYQLRKAAAADPNVTKFAAGEETLNIPAKLMYSLIGLALGGLLSEKYLTSEKDTDLERTLKLLLGAGGGSVAGYYHKEVFDRVRNALANALQSDQGASRQQ